MPCTLTREQIDQTIAFHGHWCPGLTYGIRAAEWALTELCDRSADEELATVVETDMCGVDAIQYLTGCTFGKGNLIHLDYGKIAFTFYRRSDGRAARLVAHQRENHSERRKMAELLQKRQAGNLSAAEENLLADLRQRSIQWLMTVDIPQIYDIAAAKHPIPAKARIMHSLVCDRCGERAMQSRIRQKEGQHLCIPCWEMSAVNHPLG
jgi:formylmethanofuran dehydrogenase subunit E